MRLIHTADWQIGKPFRQFVEREAVLQEARLAAIEKIGLLARDQGAEHVLVAGDIYDTEAPTERTLRQPMERMRQFGDVAWHLIPGNHDPHRPKGIWDRAQHAGIPSNVHLHLNPEPVALGSSAVLLPAPLKRKSEANDLTEWMDTAATAPGIIRIGLAHGSVVGFGSGGEASNPIDPRRPQSADLSYLALGDWHRTMQVGSAVWYSGTPEPDRAGSQEQGQALVVDLAGPGAPAVVVPHAVGQFRWLTREERLADTTDLADLEAKLRGLADLSSTVLRLSLAGALPLAGRAELDRRLLGVGAAMFHVDVDTTDLVIRPTTADLEAIDLSGVLRIAADRLIAHAADQTKSVAERKQAEDALIQLFIMTVANAGLPQ